MARYIDADALKQKWMFRGRDGKPYRDEIDAMPTSDVVEVVHGEWIDKGDSYYCSECDFPISNNYRLDVLNFCSHCGANMDKREVEE